MLPDSHASSVQCASFIFKMQKLRIMFLFSKGLNPPAILKRLQEEGTYATRQGILKLMKKFKSDGTFGRKPGSGRK